MLIQKSSINGYRTEKAISIFIDAKRKKFVYLDIILIEASMLNRNGLITKCYDTICPF